MLGHGRIAYIIGLLALTPLAVGRRNLFCFSTSVIAGLTTGNKLSQFFYIIVAVT
jgi:hypothetical protein